VLIWSSNRLVDTSERESYFLLACDLLVAFDWCFITYMWGSSNVCPLCVLLLPTHSCGPALGHLAMLDQTLWFWFSFASVLTGLLCIDLLAHRSKRTGIIDCPMDIGSHDLPLWPNFSWLGVSHSVRLSLFPWGTHKNILHSEIDHFCRWLINLIHFPAMRPDILQ
jgi:hypothetical protein